MKKILKKLTAATTALAFGITLLPVAAMAAPVADQMQARAAGDVAIDAQHFPDPIFRNHVGEYYDSNHDQVLSQAECNEVTLIGIGSWNDIPDQEKIASLKGIEYFPNLRQIDCEYHKLRSIDASKNKKLMVLHVDHNQLTKIDVTQNPEMMRIEAGYNQLTTLDVSKNPKLIEFNCNDNHLSTIDVSHNPALEELIVPNNPLTTLDVRHNTKLWSLYCNNCALTSLDISQNTSLAIREVAEFNYFECDGNVRVVDQRTDVTLPAPFDVAKVKSVKGGTFDQATGKFSFANGVNEATYQYDVGRDQTKTFTLKCNPVDDSNPFVDVQPSDFYYAPVQWAVEKGITGGTSASTFSPNKSCTRGQAVTFLWNEAGKPAPKADSSEFTDVPADAYYAKAVQWAVEQGITSGMSATSFAPEAVCDRAQIVTFQWRANGSPAVADGSTFGDVPQDAYYKQAIQWAVKNDITSGTGGNKFSPAKSCTRGEIVTFLYRAEN